MPFFMVLFACSDSDIVAEVGGKEVDKATFESYLNYKKIPANAPKRYQQALQSYTKKMALVQAIERKGSFDMKAVDLEVEQLRNEIVRSRYFEEYLKSIVSDQAVESYYTQHAGDYEKKKAKVAHILFRVNPKMTETERNAKLTAAREAWSKLQKGDAFADVAQALSEDSVSGKNAGELGWIAENAIDPVFSEKVFSMKKGDVSEPFLTNYGFHIVKLLEEPVVHTQSLDSVRNTIAYQLRQKAKDAEVEALIDSVEIEIK